MTGLTLTAQVVTAMVIHAENCLPDECCGLLAGRSDGEVRFVYPLTNSNSSPGSFEIDAREHFAALTHAERNGWELIGAFHSHPTGPIHPSATDRALAGDPDWAYVIVTGDSIYAYRIAEQTVTPIDLLRVDQLATAAGEHEAS